MDYSYKKYPSNVNKYTSNNFNGYKIFDNYLELHVINKDKHYIVLCDKLMFNILYKEYWCITMTGKQDYQRPQVYCNINRKKHYLKSFLYPEFENKRIEFLNNNCLDFRFSNINLMNGSTKKVVYRKSKHCPELPPGITVDLNRKTREITGYLVRGRYFGLTKYKDIKTALNEAMIYYKNINNMRG